MITVLYVVDGIVQDFPQDFTESDKQGVRGFIAKNLRTAYPEMHILIVVKHEVCLELSLYQSIALESVSR